MRTIFLLLIHVCCLFSADFDCIVIGSSPFSLFEALYQYHSGNTVLILEESADCGGAWKAINICGIPNADLGCHQVGHDPNLKAFLEEYAGCKIVSLDNPLQPFEANRGPNGWYFSKGCFELIDHLLALIQATDIVLRNEERAETLSIDSLNNEASIQTKNQTYTTKKLIVTPMSCLAINCANVSKNYGRGKHYHLYMLIQDPTPFKFTYRGGVAAGMSRMMNLTHFVGLIGTGKQLIAIQTYNDQYFGNAQIFLDSMKSTGLIDSGAYLLDSDTYIYESGYFHQGLIHQANAQSIIEVLQTGHIQNLSRYVPKWKGVLKPYTEALQN